MHDICPSIADLTDTHPPSRSLRVHVAECASCRALARLAAACGDPLAQRSAECDEIELLIAVIAGGGALDAEDSARFARHAGRCDRCAANAAAILLDRDQIAQLLERPSAAPSDGALASGDWKPAVDPELGRALRRRRRTLLVGGAAVVAAAAASLAILASRPPPTAKSTAPEPALAPAAPRPAAPVVTGSLPTRDQELEAARTAIDGSRYALALRHCQGVLDRSPDDQDALRFCAIAACKLESAVRARGYIGRITSETRREMLRQVCLVSGIEVKEADLRFDADLDAARKAAFAGDYRTALSRCQSALRQRRGDQEANKTCAVAACKLGDARRARIYVRRIESETRQQMIRQMCEQSGVRISP